ncbi:hypothetical protein HL658_19505 [Azospirillum sp. RWY-5-1]|uniref:Uncharacterized protein n=1 Tax=Azospirillum oleiclasticum TaxID=2735135 RepID=A0ABX2TD81_9PROT|nr:hypothetical protein [Azospirillum oleiclasticum]NYZ14739.1 hypothetical protein [Azospirillum oleiclasticum]NYZ22275.1 hypothetical protein [Azospirillum oleiclasticum]
MVTLTEQADVDYLLISAIFAAITSGLLGAFLLATVHGQHAAARQAGALSPLFAAWILPLGLLLGAFWTLAAPATTSVGVAAATSALVMVLLAMPDVHAHTPATRVVAGALWGIARMTLLLSPAVVLDAAPAWALWFGLAGLVDAVAPAAGGEDQGVRAARIGGAVNGAVLATLPVFLFLTK